MRVYSISTVASMDTFRVRLNCIDHYQAVPNDDLDPPVPIANSNQNVKDRSRISVIRVFGATETGQRVLLHVHGALQYTYIEYSGSLQPEDVQIAIKTLQLSIDHALAVSYRRNPYDGKHAYVAHISLVKGVPFYGYHVGYKFYLKIYLLNPLHMTRLADLLRDGAVMKRALQPYESHMQYIAQWMCDYNLYGCAYIDCAKVKFRAPVPKYVELTDPHHQWHDRSILPENISDEFLLPKQSHCALEADLCVQDIANRSDVQVRAIHHDFIERLRPLPIEAKLVQSMAGLWKDETRRRKARMGLKDPNSSPFPPEVLITMSANPRDTSPGGWIHEEEYREKIAQIALDEQQQDAQRKVKFATFVQPAPLEDSIQTALESVDDLYPERIKNYVRSEHVFREDNRDGEQVQASIDESRVKHVSNDYHSGSDEPSSEEAKSLDADEDAINKASSIEGAERYKSPISSSEYEKYGIRKIGDLSHIDEDRFILPDELASGDPMKAQSSKRALFAKMSDLKSNKRRKLLVDDPNALPEIAVAGYEEDSDIVDSGDTEELINDAVGSPDKLQGSTIARNGEMTQSQRLKLSFPVVKNPNDPNTILRLSQKSTASQKVASPSSQQAVKSPLHKRPVMKRMPALSDNPAGAKSDSDESFGEIVIGLNFKGLTILNDNSSRMIFRARPPSSRHVESTMNTNGLPDTIYREAYYSKEQDVPEQAREYAGREFKIESDTVPYLPDFDPTGSSTATFGSKPSILIDRPVEEVADRQRRKRCTIPCWTIADLPPRKADVVSWLEEERAANASINRATNSQKPQLSQIDCPTQLNKHGFKYAQKKTKTSVQYQTQYMTAMSLEIHVNTRRSLAPNPEEDQVACIFWCVETDDESIEENVNKKATQVGIIVVAEEHDTARKISRNVPFVVDAEVTELDALTKLVDIVRYYDPDILTGYEVHNNSWGYLIERARSKYDLNLCDELSRMKSQSHGRFGKEADRWGFNHTSTIRVTGRHTINIWRAMRGELNLLQYTMENVVFHLLQQRIPHYAFNDLAKWYKSKNPRDVAKTIEYFSSRVQLNLEILDANELVPRTSEQARLLGVDWFSVISRGSQFKVESLMFRIAKPENFILVSPSKRQVGGQNALECLPLVMEPQSNFYTSPLLVLDFQSLYPSIMIAYNYCYSTFLGRIVSWRGSNKMGFTHYQRQQQLIELLKDYINIAPNGMMYVKPEIRKSLLAKMLSEILETRVMVKSGMKVDKEDGTLQRLLNNRQLALKLIANVTYGYTSASFSGRMPCSEIADSIVQTARETLEKAIALIHSVERWGAEVVYGDTDSLFVYLKGRTREQAFDIGEEIAETITKMNPRPVKLKFEKVYHPCVLLAKKRYVGFKYESRKQTVPDFDAKGIETVRRDGTPAEQKIEENALKVLFRTADLSLVKNFFQTQCAKIMRGKVSIQDFCFAKEVKLGTYSDKGPPPPGALISARRMLEDPRLEPQYGERVPYVVMTGGPGARLIDRCVSPDTLLNNAHAELDAEYYISKNIIPPLERIFNLVGANVRQWYDEMPKYQRIRRVEGAGTMDGRESGPSKKTLESYMKSSTCLVCRDALDSNTSLCSSCLKQASQSLLYLRSRLTKAEKKVLQLEKICRSCSGLGWGEEIRCDSKDCPVFYSRTRQRANLVNESAQILPIIEALENRDEDSIDW